MVNKPLIRPYFWGGTLGGGWLTSHDNIGVHSKKLQTKTGKLIDSWVKHWHPFQRSMDVSKNRGFTPIHPF